MTKTRLFSLLAAAALAAALLALPTLADYKAPAPNPSGANSTKTTILNGVYFADDGTYVGLKGDSAATSATACYSDNYTTQTSGKIHSFRTGGTELSFVDFAGRLGQPTTVTAAVVTNSGGSAISYICLQ
jgi:hypothetical protein